VNSPDPRYREWPERQLDHVLDTLVQGTDTACQSPAKHGLWRAGEPAGDYIREIIEVLVESVEHPMCSKLGLSGCSLANQNTNQSAPMTSCRRQFKTRTHRASPRYTAPPEPAPSPADTLTAACLLVTPLLLRLRIFPRYRTVPVCRRRTVERLTATSSSVILLLVN